MVKNITIAIILAIVVFTVDQYIKSIFLDGFVWHSKILSLYLVLNKGVAFSMFAFLGDGLRYIQIAIMTAIGIFLSYEKIFFKRNFVAVGILFGAGCGNIIDRFLHGGVVDYIAWHYGFEFAVFNFADVMINFAIFLVILRIVLDKRAQKI